MAPRIPLLPKSLSTRGYVGPVYDGVRGKFRLALQGLFGHEEVVSFAEPSWWSPPRNRVVDVSLTVCDSFNDCRGYLSQMRSAYGRDFAQPWSTYFSWGQTLTVALRGNRLAGFGWIQWGDRGATMPYGPLLPKEARLVRGGVLPEFRGQGVHTSRYVLVLGHLFSQGVTRVYVDAFSDNIYSRRAQQVAGMREAGRLRCRSTLCGRTWVRWLPKTQRSISRETLSSD